jgi:hypothetical protein
MNFFGFHAPSSAWLLALLAPLVAFYFLKLKRPRLTTPSLVLWRQALADQRVNSPFQRFKRNILLILQILILLAVALAAMQPFWRGRDSRAQRLPILIDCSASMGALDKAGGVTRLEAAKERVRRQIDGMLPEQELCLISFSATARKRAGFTNDKRLLRAALDEVHVEDVPADVEDALRLAQALARTASFEEALLLSDGNFPMRAQVELAFKLNYQRVPPGGPNLGITAMNARRATDGSWDLFIGVEASAGAGGDAALELYRDEERVDRQSVSLAGGRPERILFRVGGERASRLRAKLIPEGFDSLACDNTALLELPAVRPLFVYCPASMGAFRHALEALPGLRVFPEKEGEAAQSSYDLVITDRTADLALPARALLAVGIVPADAGRLLTVVSAAGQVVDWQRGAALLQHVELGDLMLLDRPTSNAGVADSDYTNLGYDVLAHGRAGPLMLAKEEPGRRVFHLLFHTDRSTLPYRVGFPILAMNLTRIALQDAGLAEVSGTRTGVLPPVRVGPERACTVTGPDGVAREGRSDKAGFLNGVAAPKAGLYRIAGGGGEIAVGASLLNAGETQLQSTERIVFNEELKVIASKGAVREDRSLWRALAIFGFVVLLVEWWYFQRRR